MSRKKDFVATLGRTEVARRSIRSVVLIAVVIVGIGAVIGVIAGRYAARLRPGDAAASRLAQGEPREAEEKYWTLLQNEPVTLERILGLLNAHASAGNQHAKGPENTGTSDTFVTDAAIDAFLARADLDPDTAQLAKFWREVLDDDLDPDLEKWVVGAADREAPPPFANRLLANEAEMRNDLETAAPRYLREGRLIAGHADDIDLALEIYEDEHDWPAFIEATRDPNVEKRLGPSLRARLAAESSDWRMLPKWSFLSTYPKPALAPFTLAVVAAIAWGAFCARLGHVRDRPFFRCFIYLSAFALGALSVSVTDMAILVEEAKLHLVATGDPVRDALFYVFGVGFREELSKLLLFVPLLPILRRSGKKIDVVVAGAFVGLGFAAVENLAYLSSGDLTTGVGRFLSANFLHMAMTAILASALDDFIQHGDEHAPELSRTVLTVIVLHGLYDFFISHPKIGGGYLSMFVFFILANRFLITVEAARGRAKPDDTLLTTFVVGIAVVVAVSFVWASILVGPAGAATALSGGILGSAILIYAFGRRFREM